MSLIHRVTSIDGQDREFDHHGGTVRSVRRVISYDAFHPTEEAPEQDHAHHPLHTVTAYKVSTVKRAAQVAFTVLACWLASGIVFGFAALKPVLVDVGVYRDLCTPEELMDDVDVCFEQDLRYVPELESAGKPTDDFSDSTSSLPSHPRPATFPRCPWDIV
jgi:hypothetical protein